MGQKKLVRFEAIKSFPNVLQYPEGISGKWHAAFQNQQSIVLELACGRGEYTVGLSRIHPEKNFIGIDLKGNRIYIGAKKCLDENITNARFLRIQIDRIDEYFAKDEVDEIWLTFPDPQLRKSRSKKRLTHPKFLRLYKKLLVPGGRIHLKTDSPVLYRFTLLVIEMYGLILHADFDDAYKQPGISEVLKIKTHYERLDIAGSNRIYYLCFSLPGSPLPDNDELLQQRVKEDETATD